MLVFDIESDGLLDDITLVHCITLIDRKSGKHLAFNGGVYADGTPAPRDGSIEEGLTMLEAADEIAGHNIINYDIPAIRKIYPKWRPRGRIVDTQVLAQVVWTNLKDKDMAAIAKGKLPFEFQKRGLINRHSLEAWGMRLGVHKGDFDPGNYTDPETGEKLTWKTIGFTKEMDAYARQDPVTTLALLEKIESKNYSRECFDLETRVAQIIFRQTERGFAFDMERALALVAKLQQRHAEISGSVAAQFQPWYAPKVEKGTALKTTSKTRREFIDEPNGPVVRKRKVDGVQVIERGHYRHFEAGTTFTKIQQLVFNPDSRDHIADRLMKVRGWKPTEFTDEGAPKVDETILDALPYPEAKVLSEYLMLSKRLGQVSDGKEAWIKHAVRTGIYGHAESPEYRIHGKVTTNGAVTGRMTHSRPNVAQTPAVGAPHGEDCRMCFIAGDGYVLVGCDAEGLELRMLAHFMALHDGGAYVEIVLNGKKEDGTDVHSVNMRAIGLNKRDNAKTFVYALIYGAGDFKLGTIVYDDFTNEQRVRFLAKFNTKRKLSTALKKLGTARRARMMENLPALGKLVERVKAAAKAKGYLIGLDGRHLHVRSEHSALNTLLQSGGAIVMKKALVILDDEIQANTSGDVHYVANVHDEFQLEARKEESDDIGKLSADCIRLAGVCYKLRCPLAGSYGVGRNWAETH